MILDSKLKGGILMPKGKKARTSRSTVRQVLSTQVLRNVRTRHHGSGHYVLDSSLVLALVLVLVLALVLALVTSTSSLVDWFFVTGTRTGIWSMFTGRIRHRST